MASTLAMGAVITAILASLRASVTLTTHVAARVYPDDNGDVPQKPGYPYVQVESGGESAFGANTMGEPSAAKWGSVPRVQIRVGSQSRSDAQANAISNVVKQILDGQSLTVTGYPFVTVEFRDLEPLRDFTAGVPTREWVNVYEVTVHQ